MLETEERLFDEYKTVDKICKDKFLSQSGVNQYIAEMERNFSYGRSVISSWNDDYYKLKHMRWLRNKIAHESDATSCNWDDIAWLKEFHSRLVNRQDPLALLAKFNREQEKAAYMRKAANNQNSRKAPLTENEKPPKSTVTAAIVCIEIFIIIVAAFAFLGYITNL